MRWPPGSPRPPVVRCTAGLATPLAAASLIGTMITAIRMVHLPNGPWSANGGYEYNLVLIAALLALVDGGPGKLSGDAAFGAHETGGRWAHSPSARRPPPSRLSSATGARRAPARIPAVTLRATRPPKEPDGTFSGTNPATASQEVLDVDIADVLMSGPVACRLLAEQNQGPYHRRDDGWCSLVCGEGPGGGDQGHGAGQGRRRLQSFRQARRRVHQGPATPRPSGLSQGTCSRTRAGERPDDEVRRGRDVVLGGGADHGPGEQVVLQRASGHPVVVHARPVAVGIALVHL